MTTNTKSCNFYGPDIPRPGEVVYVEVSADNIVNDQNYIRDSAPAVFVSLLEYGSISGAIALNELSAAHRNNQPSAKGIKIGKRFAAEILKVDVKDKIYIDLSKKAIADSKIRQNVQVRFDKAAKLNKIISACAQKFQLSEDQMIAKIAWPLYSKKNHAWDVLYDMTHKKDKEVAVDEIQALCSDRNMAQLLYDSLSEKSTRNPVPVTQVIPPRHAEPHSVSEDQNEDTTTTNANPEKEDGDEDETPLEYALDLITDAMGKVNDFSTEDIQHTVRLQLFDYRCQHSCEPNDCAMGLLQACFQLAEYNCMCLRRKCDSDPVLLAKKMRLELLTLLNLWAPVVRQLLDSHIAKLDGRNLVPVGQFELLCWVSEYCQDHANVFDEAKLFAYLLALLYNEPIDLLDEDTIFHWIEYVSQSSSHQVQVKAVGVFIDWLSSD